MKIRFLSDADLNKAIVSGVPRREPAIDFLNAHAAGLRKMKDAEVPALAWKQQRALVSHDAATMPMHFREFTKAGMRSAGVFLIPQTRLASCELGRVPPETKGFRHKAAPQPHSRKFQEEAS